MNFQKSRTPSHGVIHHSLWNCTHHLFMLDYQQQFVSYKEISTPLPTNSLLVPNSHPVSFNKLSFLGKFNKFFNPRHNCLSIYFEESKQMHRAYGLTSGPQNIVRARSKIKIFSRVVIYTRLFVIVAFLQQKSMIHISIYSFISWGLLKDSFIFLTGKLSVKVVGWEVKYNLQC